MSGIYVAGTGLISGGGTVERSIVIEVDHLQVSINKDNIALLTSKLNNISTDEVVEGGTNKYFTDARVDTIIGAKTTDDIDEGTTNKYFTDARVDTIIEPINNVIFGSINRDANGDIIFIDGSPYVEWNTGIVDKIDGYYKKLVSNNDVVDSTEKVEGLIKKVSDLRLEADAALVLYVAEKVYVAGKWVQAKASGYFGTKLPTIQSVPDTATNTFTGDSLYEIINELNNMADIYRYDKLTNTAGIYNDPITGYRLAINGNMKVKGNICFYKEGTTSGETYCLQDLVFIKSLETSTLELIANKLQLKTKTNGGIEKDATGIAIKYLVSDFEIDTTSGLKLKTKTNGGIETGSTGIAIKYLASDFEIDTTSGLKLKTKTNGGIDTTSTGIAIKYLASDFEIDTTSGLKLKDGVYQKNISIANTTSTALTNSTISLSATNVLTFTEGSLAKAYRDQAEGFKNTADTYKDQANAYANGNGTGTASTILVGAKQYRDQAEGFKNTADTYKDSANTYANGSGALSTSVPPDLDADGDTKFVGTQGAKQYQFKAQAASIRSAGSATAAGVSAGTASTSMGAAGVSATAAATSATAAAFFAAVATGSAGISGLILLGNALVNAGGEIDILAFPIQAPLQIQNEAVGLSINKYELNVNNGGYLELNDTYTSLIEWDRPSFAETLLKISLEGISGLGIKDALNSHTIIGDTLFKDRLAGVLEGTNKNIILFENKGADLPSGWYLDRFLYDSTSLFTDHTKLSISFYSKITHPQLNRIGLLVSDEETIFHTNSSQEQSSGSDNNGINIKFNTGRTGDTRIHIYVRFSTSSGIQEKEIYDNWDNIGYLELPDDFIGSKEHHYVFTFSLQQVKLYFNGIHLATHTFNFGSTTPISISNLQNHIFGGFNQGYPALTPSAYTRQYWQGTIASINVYNSVLTQAQINNISVDVGYIGDKKIFADRIKLSSDFIVNANKELKLSGAGYITESLLLAKNYLTTIPAEYITETELTAKNYLTTIPAEYITETELTAKNYLTTIPAEYITETELTAKNYLTTIPTEYITETELTAKNYLTDSSANTAGFIKSVPKATSGSLGLVKGGGNISIGADGTLSYLVITPDYITEIQLNNKGYLTDTTATTLGFIKSISTATSGSLGIVKGGGNINIAGDGTLSAVIPTVSTATSGSLGIVKGGGNISIAGDGTLSAVIPTVSTATSGLLGIVKGGANIDIAVDGTLSAKIPTVSMASIYSLGLVKLGDNINIATDGTISAVIPTISTASTETIGGIKVDGIIHTINNNTLKIVEPPSNAATIANQKLMYPPIRDFFGISGKTTTLSGLLYGNGDYTISYTEALNDTTNEPSKVFNSAELYGGQWKLGNYTNGVYNKTSSFINAAQYFGDGVKIQLPFKIKLTSFSLKLHPDFLSRAPKGFKIWGSNDGSTWYELLSNGNITYDPITYTYTESIFLLPPYEHYNHFALVVNTLQGVSADTTNLVLKEWYIYGIKITQPTDPYNYKKDSIIKYVAGSQNDPVLRNTGSWQIVDTDKVATTSSLGIVKGGSDIQIATDGTLSCLTATQYNLGIVKGGDNIKIASNGTLSCPVADQTGKLGLVKKGDNIVISVDGTISCVLPTATSSSLGIVKGGANITIDADGTLTGVGFITASTIPAPIQNTIGGVRRGGANIDIIDDGTISAVIPTEYITETLLTAKNYLTTIPTEYITETELTAKNYLTTIPAEYITETELTAKNYLTTISTASTLAVGGIKVDGTIHTINNNTLKLVEPTSKQTLGIETVERMYPPIRNFTGASGTTTTLSGQSYGNGNYTIHYTSHNSFQVQPSQVFNTQTTNSWWFSGNYTYVSFAIGGTYNKNLSIVDDTSYLGDGIRIQLPVSIKMTSYTLTHSSSLGGLSPNDFKIYGSRNGTKWFVLDTKTSITYTSNSYTGTITNNEYYSHFALSVNKIKAIHSSHNALVLEEWYIYGKETTGYYYKENSIIKYIKGDQTNTNTRDTGSWQIEDDISAEYITETELTDKNYLTTIPAEYITETELTAKNYLTTIPAEYITETELTAKNYLTTIPAVVIPTATNSVLGIVKGGGNISIAGDGTLSAVIPTNYITEADLTDNTNMFLSENPQVFFINVNDMDLTWKLYITGSDRLSTFTNKYISASHKLYYNVGDTVNISYGSQAILKTLNQYDGLGNDIGIGIYDTILNSLSLRTFLRVYNGDYFNTITDPELSFIMEVGNQLSIFSKIDRPITQTNQVYSIITFITKNTLSDICYTKAEIDYQNYLTTIPLEYITETELTAKNYLTNASATSSGFIKSVPTGSWLGLGLVKGGANIDIAADGTLSTVIEPISKATSSSLGLVKGGGNISIAGDGTLSAVIPTDYIDEIQLYNKGYLTETTVPIATNDKVGGVRRGGANIDIDLDGIISWFPPEPTIAGSYDAGITIPVLGNVIVDGLSITIVPETGVISSYWHLATTEIFGFVKGGGNISINPSGEINAIKATYATHGIVKPDNDTITVNDNGTISAVIPTASTATSGSLGLVKGGGNISIAADGTLSAVIPTVSTATSSSLGLVKGGGNVSIAGDGTLVAAIPMPNWQLIVSNNNIYNLNLGNVGIGTNDPSSYKFQVSGAIGSSGNITAFYSDERLKEITEYVSDVLPILSKIKVFRYKCNDLAASYGYDKNKKEIGLSAQEIQKYYPEVVSIAPFDATTIKGSDEIISKSGENYLTLDYERLVPVLLQGIKDLNNELNDIKTRLKKLEI